jgi:hypothetical protein
MLKKLFYASASILMLALAYHLGATSASAQAPGNPVVAMMPSVVSTARMHAITANGDLYSSGDDIRVWTRTANIFAGSTPAAQTTWGQLKATYRK